MLDTRQTNHRKALRWWTCERCGNDYPEDRVLRLKGRVMCTGENTNKCGDDEYGPAYYREELQVPYEEIPEDPPVRDWEDV